MWKKWEASKFFIVSWKQLDSLFISCIEHTIHLMASHFVSALKISSLQNSQKNIHGTANNIEKDTGVSDCKDINNKDDFNIDTSMEVEILGDDDDAIHKASITNFDAGDVVGKLMAFIAQLHSHSKTTEDYLTELPISNGCIAWHIKLWVQTHWGSPSDCFWTILAIQKVLFYKGLSVMMLRHFLRVLICFAYSLTIMKPFHPSQMGRNGLVTSCLTPNGT